MSDSQHTETSSPHTGAAESLLGASPVSRKYEAAKRLSGVRGGVVAAAKDPRFGPTLATLAAAVGAGADEDRLVALSTIMRLWAQLRSAKDEARFRELLRGALVRAVPSLSTLSDADDRTYCARALALADSGWALPFTASFVVREQAKNARAEAAAVLLEAQESVDSALVELARQFDEWSPDTKNPSESLVRRAVRVLEAIEGPLLKARRAGPNASTAVARLVRSRTKLVSGEVDREAIDALATATLRVVHALVRIRFSLAADARTYDPVTAVREWFAPYQWEKFVVSSPEAAAVASDVSEAILVLARQSRTDKVLEQRLLALSGPVGRASLVQLAAEAGVPDEIRQWLTTGEMPRPTSSSHPLAELDREASDATRLAEIFRIATNVQPAAKQMLSDTISELEVLAPRSVMPVRTLATEAVDLASRVLGMGASRRLRLRGQAGDVVEYSPHEHDLLAGSAGGIRVVRILQPAVEQQHPSSGHWQLVLKAVAEPVASHS